MEVVLEVGNENCRCRFAQELPEAKTGIELAPRIRLPLVAGLLRQCTESLRTNLFVQVRCGERLLLESSERVTVLPPDEWRDDGEDHRWLPSFVLPRDPAVLKVIGSAQRYLRTLLDDCAAGFDGYQQLAADDGNAAAIVDPQVQAIWAALQHDLPLNYINPPPSYTSRSQRLRSPSEVFRGQAATCIDLALLFASCLEFVGIYPVLFLIEGHAFPGYWRSDKAWWRMKQFNFGSTPAAVVEQVHRGSLRPPPSPAARAKAGCSMAWATSSSCCGTCRRAAWCHSRAPSSPRSAASIPRSKRPRRDCTLTPSTRWSTSSWRATPMSRRCRCSTSSSEEVSYGTQYPLGRLAGRSRPADRMAERTVAATGVRPLDRMPMDTAQPSTRVRYRRQAAPGEGQAVVPQQDIFSLVREAGVLRWRAGAATPAGPRPRAGSRAGLPAGEVVKQFAFERLASSKVYTALTDLDRNLTPRAVFRGSPGNGLSRLRNGLLEAFPDPTRAGGKKVLLLIHGTFSNSESIIVNGLQSKTAGRELLADAEKRYDLVLAYDHPTLSVSPMLNAFDLAALLRPSPARWTSSATAAAA